MQVRYFCSHQEQIGCFRDVIGWQCDWRRVKAADGWTVGALANHIWSIAKVEMGARETSTTYLQPFVSYMTRDLWTFGVNTEPVYDWITNKLTISINATVGKLVKFGSRP